MSDADLHFWFDPVCPFAWLTSRWVRQVAAQRTYAVEWRLISLRLLNAHVDYDTQFPPEYEAQHTAGLRLLRVAARVRAEQGAAAVDPLQRALGAIIFDAPGGDVGSRLVDLRDSVAVPALAAAGLPSGLADALEEPAWDADVRADTDEALRLTGKDVGTPILHFRPPEGVAFFGPVISRLPSDEDAVRLWDHVVGLAGFAGFAELKRSLRERPQLRAFGVEEGGVGLVEDWHAGSRRLTK